MNLQRLKGVASLTLACSLFAACGDDEDVTDTTATAGSASKTPAAGGGGKGGSGGSGTGSRDAGADAAVEVADGFVAGFRESLEFTTLASGRIKGDSPHGFQQTWYSTKLASVFEDDDFEAPVGSVAIKDFADSVDGATKGYAVMIKREAGYDDDNGDWYYEMRSPDGKLMQMPPPGRIADCISCHKAFASTDFLGATKIGVGSFSADYRDSSDFMTLADGLRKGDSPHGFQQTWYSSELMELFDESGFKAPMGSIAVKEFADAADGPIKGLAIMIKRERGYDADNGDWYYEMRSADGDLMQMPPPGRIADCISCHKAFADTDYLGATEVR